MVCGYGMPGVLLAALLLNEPRHDGRPPQLSVSEKVVACSQSPERKKPAPPPGLPPDIEAGYRFHENARLRL